MGQHSTYAYDNLGRVWKMIDAKNQITEYGYDNQSRLATITYADGKTVTLNYDADGNLAGYDDGVTSTSYTYDMVGRKLTETVNFGPFSKSFSYSYYKNGLKHTFTAPDNTMYTYMYGLNNEFKEVQIPGVGSITIPEYTWNRPKTITFPGGTQRTAIYDALMRIQSLSVTDPGGNPLLNYQYTYDSVGNIQIKTTEHGMYAYGYDSSNRLTNVDNPVLPDETYTYDNVGNRTTASNATGSIEHNQNNELRVYGDLTYDYDANGNLTEITLDTQRLFLYTYTTDNRLVKVENGVGGVIAEYYYDPFGRRLWKEVGGGRTYFFYAGEGVVAEYDANGNERRSYGYLPGSPFPLFLKENDAYYWYQNDHLGTPHKLIRSNGAVVWSAHYRAFGSAAITTNTVSNPLRFPGHYEDAETGLYYNKHRYYDPEIGRYITTDPIGFGGKSLNLYEYARNNPIQRYDAQGLFDWSLQFPSGNPIMDEVNNFVRDVHNLTNPALDPEFGLEDGLTEEILNFHNHIDLARRAFTWDEAYEMTDKHLRYWFAKTFLIPDVSWRASLDDWYYETNLSVQNPDLDVKLVYPGSSYVRDLRQEWDDRYPFPPDGRFSHLFYKGGNDSRNQRIKENAGFRTLLKCWIHYRRVAQELGLEAPPDLRGNELDPPMKFGNILQNGFDWDFILQAWEEAGGWNAYLTSMAQFLGSYQVSISSNTNSPNTYTIKIIDSKGWASATRRPQKMRELLHMGDRQSVYWNEPRGSHPGRFFERGGTVFFQFEFDVEEDPCAECELPGLGEKDLEREIRRALKSQQS